MVCDIECQFGCICGSHQVLNRCASANWSERKEGLLGLQALLKNQRTLRSATERAGVFSEDEWTVGFHLTVFVVDLQSGRVEEAV